MGEKQEFIELLPMSLEEAYGSVPPLQRPENFDEIKKIAREEREQQWLDKPRSFKLLLPPPPPTPPTHPPQTQRAPAQPGSGGG